MSQASEERIFRYRSASQLDCDGDGSVLRLATYREGKDTNPFFFQGRLNTPRRAAGLLRSLMTVVKSRFHIPPAMLERILAEADPVVTANDDRLRFEGFSACCGVYARIDLLNNAFEGSPSGRGTTNVDFNQPMLTALASIKQTDNVSLAIGSDQVVLKRTADQVIEKKVKLPIRWMKGFVEVQTVQSRMQPVHQIDGIHALRFFRSMPRMKTHRRTTHVIRTGKGLRLSQVKSKDAVQVGGLERLRVLEPLSRNAEKLVVYSDATTGASGWTLIFPDCRFHVILSPEVWRGFSGEGQALQSLASANDAALPKVQAALRWQSIINRDELANTEKLVIASINAALKTLGTRGLVGFDLAEQAYFHREMPFDISQVEKLQPRLKAARKLINDNNIQLKRQTEDQFEFAVAGSGVEHRVVIQPGAETPSRCTCPWHNKHGLERGPCKHILAAQIAIEESKTGT
ncbi:MAG: SWIM zinc finger domain-containing protein [Rubripirellula sp.]|nr:SWIM zinc finger domain-containing protein [Rubripirellula sp.]